MGKKLLASKLNLTNIDDIDVPPGIYHFAKPDNI